MDKIENNSFDRRSTEFTEKSDDIIKKLKINQKN
jgi:hypothetical protein